MIFLLLLLLLLPPLSHSPAGFSQMEVAQHSRPALYNLRMTEGGSASHYTRFEPGRGDDDDDEGAQSETRTGCAHTFIQKKFLQKCVFFQPHNHEYVSFK